MSCSSCFFSLPPSQLFLFEVKPNYLAHADLNSQQSYCLKFPSNTEPASEGIWSIAACKHAGRSPQHLPFPDFRAHGFALEPSSSCPTRSNTIRKISCWAVEGSQKSRQSCWARMKAHLERGKNKFPEKYACCHLPSESGYFQEALSSEGRF